MLFEISLRRHVRETRSYHETQTVLVEAESEEEAKAYMGELCNDDLDEGKWQGEQLDDDVIEDTEADEFEVEDAEPVVQAGRDADFVAGEVLDDDDEGGGDE